MTKTVEQLLGYVYLTGVIQAIKTGIPDVLPPQFMSIKKSTIGNTGRYTQVKGTRQTARLVQYGSSALRRALKGVEIKDVKLLHTFESIYLDYLILQNLRSYDSYDLQKLGIDELDRQQSEFKMYFENLRLAAIYSMLANGKIYFDSDGNLLPSSSGAVVTIDYGVNANNLNQLNGIITGSWANANTDIPAQIRALRSRSQQLTGYEIRHAFYGTNIPSYMTQNNYVLDYLSRSPTMREKFLGSDEIPPGLFGLDWHPIYSAFFEDASGTNRTFFDGDAITFTPEIDQSVYELMEGTFGVPTSFNAVANLAAAIGSLKQVTGMFSYAVPVHNPPGAENFAGDQFLPVWKVPDALFIADTTA